MGNGGGGGGGDSRVAGRRWKGIKEKRTETTIEFDDDWSSTVSAAAERYRKTKNRPVPRI